MIEFVIKTKYSSDALRVYPQNARLCAGISHFYIQSFYSVLEKRLHREQLPRVNVQTPGLALSLSFRIQSARSCPNPDADTAAPAPTRAHLHDTVISTLVAGMLPLMGSKSRTFAVASTLSMTSPSMRARDPGQHDAPRESLRTRGTAAGEQERTRSRQTS